MRPNAPDAPRFTRNARFPLYAGLFIATMIIGMEKAMNTEVEKLMTAEDVAARYGLTQSWLKRARSGGYGPPFHLLGHRTVRYYSHEVQAWIDSRLTTRLPDRREVAA